MKLREKVVFTVEVLLPVNRPPVTWICCPYPQPQRCTEHLEFKIIQKMFAVISKKARLMCVCVFAQAIEDLTIYLFSLKATAIYPAIVVHTSDQFVANASSREWKRATIIGKQRCIDIIISKNRYICLVIIPAQVLTTSRVPHWNFTSVTSSNKDPFPRILEVSFMNDEHA